MRGPVCAARLNTKEETWRPASSRFPHWNESFAAEAEERGKVEAHELDALVLEHELDEEAEPPFARFSRSVASSCPWTRTTSTST